MSAGFVSGGTIDNPTERDDEWLKAQQEIEAERRRKQEEGKQEGGRSLYDVLQQNKTTKQEAFEESIRLKNQFRSLDEDEVEFLDSVLESTRAKEAAVKRETSEQLEIFRRQREEVDKVLLDETNTGKDDEVRNSGGGSPVEEESWATSGKKRRRGKDKETLKGIKLRKTSSAGENSPRQEGAKTGEKTSAERIETSKAIQESTFAEHSSQNKSEQLDSKNKQTIPGVGSSISNATKLPPALGLGDYSSDED